MSCGSFARESECDVKYFIKKLISMAATLLVVSFLVFLAFVVIPGDPATAKLGTEATPAKVEALREEMGLNRPIPVRYAAWLGGLLQGDMGTSYSYSMPVTKMVSGNPDPDTDVLCHDGAYFHTAWPVYGKA